MADEKKVTKKKRKKPDGPHQVFASDPVKRATVIVNALQGSSEDEPVSVDALIAALKRNKLEVHPNPESQKKLIRRDIENLKKDRGAPIRAATRNRKTCYYLSGPFTFTIITKPQALEVKIPKRFREILESALRVQHCVRMKYRKKTEAEDAPLAVRLVEPHVLNNTGGAQYVVGYQRREENGRIIRERRTFALHRIVSLEETFVTFDFDDALLTEADHGDIFNFTKVEGARILADKEVKAKFIERAESRGYQVTNAKGGAVHVSLPPIPELDLLTLVLSYGGHVTLEKPDDLRAKVRAAAEQILARH